MPLTHRTAAVPAPPASPPAWRSTAGIGASQHVSTKQRRLAPARRGTRLDKGLQRVRQLEPVGVGCHEHLRNAVSKETETEAPRGDVRSALLASAHARRDAQAATGPRALMRSRSPSGSGGSSSSSSPSSAAAAVLARSVPVVLRPPAVNSSFTFWPNLCSDSPIFLPTKLTSSAASWRRSARERSRQALPAWRARQAARRGSRQAARAHQHKVRRRRHRQLVHAVNQAGQTPAEGRQRSLERRTNCARRRDATQRRWRRQSRAAARCGATAAARGRQAACMLRRGARREDATAE